MSESSGRPAAGAVIEIRSLTKSFGASCVLDGVDLDVHGGELMAVIGPSGSGKTTLLRCTNGLETYDGGSIRLGGVEVGYRTERGIRRPRSERELAAIRADVGMVFQLFNLFPHLTALENVTLGLRRVRGLAKPEARARAESWLARVGLEQKFHSLPFELSGGQQQRVAIARAVAMDPKVLLLDEITSALDPELVGEVLSVVRQLAGQGMTMMLVTHEIAFAREVASRIVFMDHGRVVIEGTPHEVLRISQQPRLRSFLAGFKAGRD
jgi:polar amino acid transport system ATP-binding protein